MSSDIIEDKKIGSEDADFWYQEGVADCRTVLLDMLDGIDMTNAAHAMLELTLAHIEADCKL